MLIRRRTNDASTTQTNRKAPPCYQYLLFTLAYFSVFLHGVWLYKTSSQQVHSAHYSKQPFAGIDDTTAATLPTTSEEKIATQRHHSSEERVKRLYNHSYAAFPKTKINVPFPIFVVSLPKSGTTSVHNFFLCGKIPSAHAYCPDNGQRIGSLIRSNVLDGNPPLQGCGDAGFRPKGPVRVFSDTGDVPPGGPCFYASVSALEELVTSYPNMTILLGTRNPFHWSNSLERWGHGRLFRRWGHYCPFMPKRNRVHSRSRNATMMDYIHFYHWHTLHIRNFTQHHPSVTYVEFSIDSPTAAMDLERATGISASCWGHHRPVVPR